MSQINFYLVKGLLINYYGPHLNHSKTDGELFTLQINTQNNKKTYLQIPIV